MAKAMRILFIGNSFTNRNDLPGMIETLGKALRPAREVETARVIANGMSLRAHLNRGEAAKAIAEGAWDYVVLQEQSTLPLKNPKRMGESAALFDELIRKAGARTVLYQTWARRNAFERQDELSEVYTSIGRELKAMVVRVGEAWKLVLTREPAPMLHAKDQSHPSAAGSYLAACVFVATLLKQTPVGLPVVAGVEEGVGRMLQEAGWEVGR